jgi:hypothetical protein
MTKASSYMTKYVRFFSYTVLGSLPHTYDFATAPVGISLYMKKIFFNSAPSQVHPPRAQTAKSHSHALLVQHIFFFFFFFSFINSPSIPGDNELCLGEPFERNT